MLFFYVLRAQYQGALPQLMAQGSGVNVTGQPPQRRA